MWTGKKDFVDTLLSHNALHKGNGGAAVHSWKIFKLMLIGGETAQGTPQKTITGKPFGCNFE